MLNNVSQNSSSPPRCCYSASCTSNVRLDTKVALITGANGGIGKATAKDFYKRGARVILACRDLEKANECITDIKKQCEHIKDVGELKAVRLDLTSLHSVRTCAEKLLKTEKSINLLINNAGVMMCPYSKTEDGYEMQFGTNHLGHFLLTLLLMPTIIRSAAARIVTVSSRGHTMCSSLDLTDLNWNEKKYRPLVAYSQSKLANILFTKELAVKLTENNVQGVNVYSLHPGVINTNLFRHLPTGINWIWKNVTSYFLKTPDQGAQTQIYCGVDEKCANETGLYYSDCQVAEPSAAAQDEKSAKELWEISLKMVGLEKNYNPFK